MTYNLRAQGIEMDMYYRLANTSEEEVKKEFNERAEASVKQQLVLSEMLNAKKSKSAKKSWTLNWTSSRSCIRWKRSAEADLHGSGPDGSAEKQHQV